MDGVSRYFDFALCLQGVVTFPWTLPLTKEETEAQGGGVTEAQGGGASVPSLPRTDEEVVEAGVTPRPAPPILPREVGGASGRSPLASPGQQGGQRWGPVLAGPPSSALHLIRLHSALNATLRGRAGGRAAGEAGACSRQTGSALPAATSAGRDLLGMGLS